MNPFLSTKNLKGISFAGYVMVCCINISFISCSKSGSSPTSPTTGPTLTIIPGTALTVTINSTATFSWTTNGTGVTVNGVAYPGGSFISPPLLVNTTYNVTSYAASGASTTVQVVVTVVPIPVDIYAAGYDFGNVVYWKNGVVNLLGPVTSPSGFGTGIAISGTDVYTSGYLNSLAAYWKNSTRTNLTTSGIAEANAITVSGSDVYVAGTDAAGSGNFAVYWKNGVRVVLQNSNQLTNAYTIVVSGTDVYAAGHVGDSAVYWKNGVRTTLSNNGVARGIAISGGDVYVVGRDQLNAVYWKNNIKTILPAISVATANSIAISGTDIYITGKENSANAVYWKNSVKATLYNSPSENSNATCIALFGSDVYIGGYFLTATYNAGVYWKNGVLTNISTGSPTGSARIVNAIAVVQR